MNEPDESEAARRAANLWYERFEKKRRDVGPPSGRQRLARWAILAAAVALLVLGLRMRGQRLGEVMAPAGSSDWAPEGARDWAPLLSRELQLGDSAGQAFFPLWEDWRRGHQSRLHERAELLSKLDELSAERSDLNAEQERLLDRLQALESEESAQRGRLLEATRTRLGLWRAARLRVLLEESPR